MKSPEQIQKDVLEYLDKRFGLGEDVFKKHRFYLASKGRLFLGPKWVPDDRKIVTVGILAGRAGNSIKPTTNLLQAFGNRVSRNFIELDRERTIQFARGQDLALDDAGGATDGYVLLRYKNTQLGCGLLRGRSVRNMLPKAKRLDVSFL